MLQDKDYQFQCCGVAERIEVSGSSLKLRVWRQDGANSFVLISAQDYQITGNPYNVIYGERLSFREGDWIGWTGSTVDGISDAGYNLNWISATSFPSSNIKTTHNWYNESVNSGQQFQIKVHATGSTAPYFKNLPAKLRLPDTEVQTGGINLITLTVNDLDPDDKDELYVTMSPGWEDVFEYDATTKIVTTKVSLDVDVNYMVSFRVEEEHCGVSTTATLTVTVYDSKPSITNLPAFTTLHEDVEDEQLLYTVTMSDPTNQAMWCKGEWLTSKPFRVKMISTEPGDSKAGIYLIEDPRLDYTANQKYDLKVLCYDTYEHEVSGMYYVNIQENRKPIFRNLANAIEIDAREVISGATVFTISTKDADDDKITFGSVKPVCDKTDCPFAVFDSGEVRVTANLLFTPIQTYTLSIPATDVRQTITSRKLVIHVSNRNNAPTFNFTAVSKTINVAENSALGTSLLQLSATDADDDPLTFYMSVMPPAGYQLFELTINGELRTHSSNNIDLEAVSATAFTMEIAVHDTKQHTLDTLTLNIIDVNEAPEFLQPYYMSRGDESDTAGQFHSNPGIVAFDPDNGDTLTYSLDCGQYADYFSIASDASVVSLLKAYDLDDTTADLPSLLVCSLVVKDNVDNNATATLYITVDYINDNPTTFDKPSYAVTVRSDTPLGFTILTVRVSDADRGNNITQKLELDQTSLQPSGDLFVIHTDGSIHANKLLNETVSYGTKTIQVIATDPDESKVTANIVITFVDASVTPVVVEDRDRLFIEDFRNIWWVSACAMIMSVCVFLVLCITCVTCCFKGEPLINVNAIKAMFRRQPKPESKIEKKNKKFGGQKQPVYRHIHSNEILRHSPVPVETIEADDMSVRANSIMSGRVSASDVKVKENKTKNKKKVEPSWMDGTATPSVRQAPVKAVAKANPEDWEYLNPRKMGESPRQSQPYTPSEYITSAKQGKNEKKLSGKTVNKGLGVSSRVDVNPSPVQMDNTMDLEDDDFRSERLSIASPSSMIADD
ncbi:protocadherin Fat 4-like [Dreissena polymorpha]|nr:protocadherin Fat 4-like [Dreissena polymorpha]